MSFSLRKSFKFYPSNFRAIFEEKRASRVDEPVSMDYFQEVWWFIFSFLAELNQKKVENWSSSEAKIIKCSANKEIWLNDCEGHLQWVFPWFPRPCFSWCRRGWRYHNRSHTVPWLFRNLAGRPSRPSGITCGSELQWGKSSWGSKQQGRWCTGRSRSHHWGWALILGWCKQRELNRAFVSKSRKVKWLGRKLTE